MPPKKSSPTKAGGTGGPAAGPPPAGTRAPPNPDGRTTKVEPTQAQKDLLAAKRNKRRGEGRDMEVPHTVDVNILEQEFALAVAAGQAE